MKKSTPELVSFKSPRNGKETSNKVYNEGSSGNYKVTLYLSSDKVNLEGYSRVRVTSITLNYIGVEDLYLEVDGLGIKDVIDFSTERGRYHFKLNYDGRRYTTDSFSGLDNSHLTNTTMYVRLKGDDGNIINPPNDWSFTLEYS